MRRQYIVCLLFTIFLLSSCANNKEEFDDSIYLLADEGFDYSASPNYGKSLALFGGSFACIKQSSSAISYWRNSLNLNIKNYAVSGAGFSSLSSVNNIQTQVDYACSESAPKYDIYLLWASTNDYKKVNGEIGTSNDYTIVDNYDRSKLRTQCGGINYCIRKIYSKNKNAKILFFSSIGRFDDLGKGTDPNFNSETCMAKFVYFQKQCCENNDIPFLNQFNTIITESNFRSYVQADLLHLNTRGYDLIKHVQALFIAQN